MEQRTLGKALRKARHAQFLMLKELADRIGISTTQLGKLERGAMHKPPIYALPAIAQHYGIPYEDLIALSDWTPLERKALTPAQ